MWLDSLVPVRRRAMKSSQEENSVHQFDLTEEEDILQKASLIFLNIFELNVLRGPVVTISYGMLAPYTGAIFFWKVTFQKILASTFNFY